VRHTQARKITLASLQRAELVENGSELVLVSRDETVPNRYFRLGGADAAEERDGSRGELEYEKRRSERASEGAKE
jgi:hypothetical protein